MCPVPPTVLVCACFASPTPVEGQLCSGRWHEELPAAVEVCGIELPGREGRWKERPIADARQVFDQLIPALESRLNASLVLYGHSMGAMLVFEMSCELLFPQPAAQCRPNRPPQSFRWREETAVQCDRRQMQR
jgi:medium-chain acyl-[acyl-carrier-protein] hydrolase